MSVPVRNRSENKLQALKDTLAFCDYTIKTCENEKYFPKKSRWTIANRIIDDCVDCIGKISKANKINPKNKEEAKKRTNLQVEVLLNFEELWSLMTLAKETYQIENNRIENWCTFLMIAENTVTAWKNSDIKRYKEQFGD